MAFASTITGSTVMGNVRFVYGTFTNAAADNGGDIETGGGTVLGFGTVPTSDVDAAPPKYSASSGTVTLVTGYGVDGNWFAFLYGGG